MSWEQWFDAYLDASAAQCHLGVHGHGVRVRVELGFELEPIEIRAEKVWRHARKIYAFNELHAKRESAINTGNQEISYAIARSQTTS